MIYILENEYTKKLYNSINTGLCLISTADLFDLKHDETLIIDEIDLPNFNHMKLTFLKVIVLGEVQAETSNHFTFISKYQSYKNIFKLIFDSSFPVNLLTSSKTSAISPDLIKRFAMKTESDYIISLNYSHSSAFSLYDCLNGGQYIFEKGKLYEIMSNFQDYMKPPIDEIVKLVEQLRKNGTVLIVSTPIKGPLDLVLLKQSNTLMWLDDPTNIFLDKEFKRINPNIQIHYFQSSQLSNPKT